MIFFYYDAWNWKRHVFKTSSSLIRPIKMPNKKDNLRFFAKITVLWCLKILKKHVFKTSPRQNHATKITKQLEIIYNMMSKNIEKKMYLRRHKGKIISQWCHKKDDFFLISHYYDIHKYWKKVSMKDLYKESYYYVAQKM